MSRGNTPAARLGGTTEGGRPTRKEPPSLGPDPRGESLSASRSPAVASSMFLCPSSSVTRIGLPGAFGTRVTRQPSSPHSAVRA
jgi:hypothetical protein